MIIITQMHVDQTQWCHSKVGIQVFKIKWQYSINRVITNILVYRHPGIQYLMSMDISHTHWLSTQCFCQQYFCKKFQ